MRGEQALGERAQIRGRREVAILEELALREARPVGEHAAALHRAARHEGDRAGAVIGALGAVHPHGAAEFGHGQHHGLLSRPRRARRAARPCRRRAGRAAGAGAFTCAPCVSQPSISSAAMRGPSGLASRRPAMRGERGEAAARRPSRLRGAPARAAAGEAALLQPLASAPGRSPGRRSVEGEHAGVEIGVGLGEGLGGVGADRGRAAQQQRAWRCRPRARSPARRSPGWRPPTRLSQPLVMRSSAPLSM